MSHDCAGSESKIRSRILPADHPSSSPEVEFIASGLTRGEDQVGVVRLAGRHVKSRSAEVRPAATWLAEAVCSWRRTSLCYSRDRRAW